MDDIEKNTNLRIKFEKVPDPEEMELEPLFNLFGRLERAQNDKDTNYLRKVLNQFVDYAISRGWYEKEYRQVTAAAVKQFMECIDSLEEFEHMERISVDPDLYIEKSIEETKEEFESLRAENQAYYEALKKKEQDDIPFDTMPISSFPTAIF